MIQAVKFIRQRVINSGRKGHSIHSAIQTRNSRYMEVYHLILQYEVRTINEIRNVYSRTRLIRGTNELHKSPY